MQFTDPHEAIALLESADRPLAIVLTERFDEKLQLDPDGVAAAYPDAEVVWLSVPSTKQIAAVRDFCPRLPFNGGFAVYPPADSHVRGDAYFSPELDPHRMAAVLQKMVASAETPDGAEVAYSTSTSASSLRQEREEDTARLLAENARLRSELAAERAKRTAAARPQRSSEDAVPWESFERLDDAIFEAVRRAWVDLVPAGEKAAYPLTDFALSPHAAEGLRGLDGVKQGKVVRALAKLSSGMQVNALEARRATSATTGYQGAPVIRAADQASAWRGVAEQNAPGAARIAWWQLPGGGIEVSDIALHDLLRNPQPDDSPIRS